MASSRPGGFKKGGGFLNNVVGVIVSYLFTTEFPGGDGSKPANAKFTPLYFVLTAQVDGAEKEQSTTLFAGSADEWEISDDGLTLEAVDDSSGIRSNSDLGRFVASMVEGGFDENQLPEDGEPINYESFVGQRVNFVQQPDEDAMKKQAKTFRKSNGKYNEQGQKKGKDGKYYNLTYLTVSEVLGEAEVVAPKATAAKGKTAAAAGGKKTNGKAEPDIRALATETLTAILADNDGSIAKSKLPQAIAKKLGVKHPQREEVRQEVYSDAFLKTENGWSYDAKKQIITADDAE
jgi:hypothetical protein